MKHLLQNSITFKATFAILSGTLSVPAFAQTQNPNNANPFATPANVLATPAPPSALKQATPLVKPLPPSATNPAPATNSAFIPLPSSSWSIYLDDVPTATGITWKKEPHVITVKSIKGKATYVTQLNGSFNDKKHSSLLIDSVPVPVGKDGTFSFDFPLSTKDTSTPISIVDSLGNIQKEKIIVKFIQPVAQAPAKVAATPVPVAARVERSNYSTTVGASLTLINYEQTSLAPFREYAVTGKAAVTYSVPASRLSYSGSIFFTGVPFGTTSPDQVTLSFFGFNARVGYELPWLRRPWKLSIMGGLYFTSANARGGSSLDTNLGYSVSGIQGLMTLNRSFRRGDSIGIYTKFAPLSDGISFNPASSEIAVGLAYNFVPNVMGRGFGVSTDYSKTQLTIGALNAKTSTLSFGANYHF